MPIYEYVCEECGEWEEIQKVTDPPLTHCLRCCQVVKRRLISEKTSFRLDGGGWAGDGYEKGKNDDE